MSKTSDKLEQDLANIIGSHSRIPLSLPAWMIDLGIKPGAKIVNATRIGATNAKTDVLVTLEDSTNIKISAKLNNAHFFGNWYTHKRILDEFGTEAFQKLTIDATRWANDWMKVTSTPFIGVSICFGERKGRTGRDFLHIFTLDDIISIVKGYGDDDDDKLANCLFISSTVSSNIEEIIQSLKPISHEVISSAVGDFKIAYRPINPLTEYTNRSKQIYSQFVPFKKFTQTKTVDTIDELRTLGLFQTVIANNLNHNKHLDNLERNYNLIIPRKPKKK